MSSSIIEDSAKVQLIKGLKWSAALRAECLRSAEWQHKNAKKPMNFNHRLNCFELSLFYF
jgi:hypothetical protein